MKNRIRTILILMFCMVSFGPLRFVGKAASGGLGRVTHQKNSLYNSIFVYENGSVVTLKFGKRASLNTQSQVDLNDPRRHMLEYTKLTFCGLFYKPEPKRMLVLGLGG
jgi:spermidine synthase